MDLNFSKNKFTLGYGLPFTIIQLFFGAGFLLTVIYLILPGTIEFPDGTNVALAIYGMTSIVTFPIITLIKYGYAKLIKKSNIKIESDSIVFDRLKEYMWTAAGHIAERHIYHIKNITSLLQTRRNMIIRGDIDLEIIYNNRLFKKQKVGIVKIPIAFENIERINEYANK